MKVVTLSAGALEVGVVPDLGGGIASFDWQIGRGETIPIFRRAADLGDPLDLGMIVLAPWSNRISGGGFMLDGVFHSLPRNLERSVYPVHGNAFQARWRIVEQSVSRLSLALATEGPGPYAYAARLIYSVDPGALAITLGVTNQAKMTLPYGLGLHPWLTRTPAMTLWAPARRIWFFDERQLQGHSVEPAFCPNLDFAAPGLAPQGAVAAWFTGWNGEASVAWPEWQLGMTITASPELPVYLLYAPDAAAEFLCFEPVSHGINAHNMSYSPGDGPLTLLQPGEELTATVRFAVGCI